MLVHEPNWWAVKHENTKNTKHYEITAHCRIFSKWIFRISQNFLSEKYENNSKQIWDIKNGRKKVFNLKIPFIEGVLCRESNSSKKTQSTKQLFTKRASHYCCSSLYLLSSRFKALRIVKFRRSVRIGGSLLCKVYTVNTVEIWSNFIVNR